MAWTRDASKGASKAYGNLKVEKLPVGDSPILPANDCYLRVVFVV